MTFGSLFAGIGGFDLGFERAGFNCRWQVERDKNCIRLLRRHWPHVWRWTDAMSFAQVVGDAHRVDCIVGGDPCPRHSNARRGQESVHPDLAGYFLAVVGRLRPQWVVRENVPSPTVRDFATCLEALGYGAVIVYGNSLGTTGQSRQRAFVVGQLGVAWHDTFSRFGSCKIGRGHRQARLAMEPSIACLTSHRTRNNTDDNYVWDGQSFRRLSSRERERFAGFDDGWTDGFSPAVRARFCGLAVDSNIAEWIARRILATQ